MGISLVMSASSTSLANSGTIASALSGAVSNISFDLATSSTDKKLIYGHSLEAPSGDVRSALYSNHKNFSTKTGQYTKSTFKFTVPAIYDKAVTITFIAYQNGEINYDYGIFSVLDKSLAAGSNADDQSTTTSANVHKSLKGLGQKSTSASDTTTGWGSEILVKYENIPAGDHTIDIKYRTDGSNNFGADTMAIVAIQIDVNSNINALIKDSYQLGNIAEYYDSGSGHWTAAQLNLAQLSTITSTGSYQYVTPTDGVDYVTWCFKAPKTATYTFNVKRDSGSTDTGGSLWTSGSTTTSKPNVSVGATSGYLASNDGSSTYGGNQPGFSYACTAGQYYFFQLSYYNSTVRNKFCPSNVTTKLKGTYTLYIGGV